MRIFTEHPASVDESYTEHMGYAASVGGNMIIAGIACVIHGFLPFLFETTGSRTVAKLHNIMMQKRNATYSVQVEIEKREAETGQTEPAPLEVRLDKAA